MREMKRFLLLSSCLMLSVLWVFPALAQGTEPIEIIFLHHSCGQNLIEEGQVREGLSALGYKFYDHGYNGDGLRLSDGTWTGESFNVPDDNTDPDGFAAIFSQPLLDPPENTFSLLMQYDVIVFKSCFPVSNIMDDAQLAAYQSYYLTIRDTTDQYPEKLFVIVTQPPQVPNNTTDEEALRARTFTDWLASDEYLDGHSNLSTFDFFDLLAGDDHTLRREYRVDVWDAHPNTTANQEIGPIFVDFLDNAIRDHFGAATLPAADEEPESEGEPVETGADSDISPIEGGGSVDFDEGTWYADTDGVTSSIDCSSDAGLSLIGESSLYVNYALGENGYASCANQFDAPVDWSDGEGVRFYLRSDRAGQEINLFIYSGPLAAPVPFMVSFETSDVSVESWNETAFAWDDFSTPDWYGESDVHAIDLANIISIIFSMESQSGTQGQFWVDGLSLMLEESQIEEEPLPESDVESSSEENGLSRICPFSTLILPMLVGVVLVMRGKEWNGKKSSRLEK